MKPATTRTKSGTLSVGETAKRLDVSSDTVRNYCERGWLQFTRGRGNHRRVSLRSIESFEAQRNPKKPHSVAVPHPLQQKPQRAEDAEIYYLGNDGYPNEIEPGYICNFSFFKDLLPDGFNPSTVLGNIGRIFGGGKFKIVRLLDGDVVSERVFSLPGPTKSDVATMREIYMD